MLLREDLYPLLSGNTKTTFLSREHELIIVREGFIVETTVPSLAKCGFRKTRSLQLYIPRLHVKI